MPCSVWLSRQGRKTHGPESQPKASSYILYAYIYVYMYIFIHMYVYMYIYTVNIYTVCIYTVYLQYLDIEG